MFPVTLDLAKVRILLVGRGPAALRRLEQLQEAGAMQVEQCFDMPRDTQIRQAHLVMVADMPDQEAALIAEKARAMGKLVNVEDRKPHCDFHFPSQLRRGDLLVTVSTAGQSPALAKLIRDFIGEQLPDEWSERLSEIANLRDAWRAQGLSMAEVSERSRAAIEEKGWLPSRKKETELA